MTTVGDGGAKSPVGLEAYVLKGECCNVGYGERRQRSRDNSSRPGPYQCDMNSMSTLPSHDDKLESILREL